MTDAVQEDTKIVDPICCAIKKDGNRCGNKWKHSHGGKGYCGVHIRGVKSG
jgi:hypothetical protein